MKEFSLIRPSHLGLLAVVYLPVIPTFLYWSLVLITLLYTGQRTFDESSCSSAQRHHQQQSLFGSKRFQQLWFAVKRFSPIHRPRIPAAAADDDEEVEEEEALDNDNNKDGHQRHRSRKLSASENEHLVHDTLAGTYKLSWSPFGKRKHHQSNFSNTREQYGLYSSHPEIINNINNNNNTLHDDSEEYHLQDTVVKMLRKKEKVELTGNDLASSSPSKSSSSPLSRIKKIKRDMQRCVTRDSSSDYELNDQNGNPKKNSSSKANEENVQLLANNTTNSVELNGCTEVAINGDKRFSVEHLDDDDLEMNFDSTPLQLTNLIGQKLPLGIIPLDKVDNYVSEKYLFVWKK